MSLPRDQGPWLTEQIKALRQSFARFLKACKDALDLNCAHLMHNQAEYHETLKAAEERMREQLQPLLSGTATSAPAVRQTSKLNGCVWWSLSWTRCVDSVQRATKYARTPPAFLTTRRDVQESSDA